MPTDTPETPADARVEPDDEHPHAPQGPMALLALGALGIVYGDIGTSPLYAVRESFSGHFGIAPTPESVLGVLSLITWSLVLVVSIQYLGLVLRADNAGEGGILALTALVRDADADDADVAGWRRWRGRLVLLGLFGGALLFGDGVLTPAISVLSAFEGLRYAAPPLAPFVVPLTVAVLVGLFMLQRRGTARVGALFGPVMMVWFLTLAALGVHGVVRNPGVLQALAPTHAIAFLAGHGLAGFLVLGAVFLVVTGAEALYADLGHFGRAPIRRAWFGLVLPALLLNYFGQGALVLADAAAVENPFYLLAPAWGRVPLLILATMATVIASQAVITGVFSLAMQAVQLGYWPRMRILHTSPRAFGQVYVPAANWGLMLLTLLLVLSFGSSSALAAAYGIAIVLTMITTTLLLMVVAPRQWGWPAWAARGALTVFLGVELTFLGANLFKIHEGGWVPLALAAAIFLLLWTWRSGRRALGARLRAHLVPLPRFLDALPTRDVVRVPGTAIYMTGNAGMTPAPLIKNLEHQRTLHERVVLLSLVFERVPHIEPGRRVDLEDLPHGFHRVTARYGFMETPDVVRLLWRLRRRGLHLPLEETTFFLGRERPVSGGRSPLARARVMVFSWMIRNSQRATAYFNIPPDRVVEVGSQIEM